MMTAGWLILVEFSSFGTYLMSSLAESTACACKPMEIPMMFANRKRRFIF